MEIKKKSLSKRDYNNNNGRKLKVHFWSCFPLFKIISLIKAQSHKVEREKRTETEKKTIKKWWWWRGKQQHFRFVDITYSILLSIQCTITFYTLNGNDFYRFYYPTIPFLWYLMQPLKQTHHIAAKFSYHHHFLTV